MLLLCIITQCACQMRRKGDMSVGIVWELKTVTCRSVFLDPHNKISCFHLNAESRQLNTLFYRVMHRTHSVLQCQSACLSWHLNAKCSLFEECSSFSNPPKLTLALGE